jgi:hypothetical protein
MKYSVYNDENQQIIKAHERNYSFLNIRAMDKDKFKGILHGKKKNNNFIITEVTGEPNVRQGLRKKLRQVLPETCSIEQRKNQD